MLNSEELHWIRVQQATVPREMQHILKCIYIAAVKCHYAIVLLQKKAFAIRHQNLPLTRSFEQKLLSASVISAQEKSQRHIQIICIAPVI